MSDHVHYHVDHLFFFVRYLCEREGGQMYLVVDLEYVFEGGEGVDHVPAIVLVVFIHFHSRRAAAHFFFFVVFIFKAINLLLFHSD